MRPQGPLSLPCWDCYGYAAARNSFTVRCNTNPDATTIVAGVIDACSGCTMAFIMAIRCGALRCIHLPHDAPIGVRQNRYAVSANWLWLLEAFRLRKALFETTVLSKSGIASGECRDSNKCKCDNFHN